MLLSSLRRGKGEPALVLMPFLGGSHREWDRVIAQMRGRPSCFAIDLPGFGDSSEIPGYTMAEMAESVAETVAALELSRFVLVGHSMGGKVAAVMARGAADGDPRLRGLEGLVLVAPSPPRPEPMTEKKRSQMLEALGGEPREGKRGVARDRAAAEQYVRENAADDLLPAEFAAAVEVVLGMKRAAWRAWLESGSREDWAERVGVLRLPVLLVAGDKDAALGTEVQKTVSMPHWPNGRLSSLHSNHLIPMEKPVELARLIAGFVEELNGRSARAARAPDVAEVPIDPSYVALILSDRVSNRTREVLEGRAGPDDAAYEPTALSVMELAQMRELVDRVVPQRGPVKIDLGARIDRQLGMGRADGWRPSMLPESAEAYRSGLQTLEWHAQEEFGVGWLALEGDRRDELLAKAAAGRLERGLLARLEAVVGAKHEGGPIFSGEKMQRWFERMLAEVLKLYVGHPATLGRMYYSGIADGADSKALAGFVQIGEGESESWEPGPRTPRRGGTPR